MDQQLIIDISRSLSQGVGILSNLQKDASKDVYMDHLRELENEVEMAQNKIQKLTSLTQAWVSTTHHSRLDDCGKSTQSEQKAEEEEEIKTIMTLFHEELSDATEFEDLSLPQCRRQSESTTIEQESSWTQSTSTMQSSTRPSVEQDPLHSNPTPCHVPSPHSTRPSGSSTWQQDSSWKQRPYTGQSSIRPSLGHPPHSSIPRSNHDTVPFPHSTSQSVSSTLQHGSSTRSSMGKGPHQSSLPKPHHGSALSPCFTTPAGSSLQQDSSLTQTLSTEQSSTRPSVEQVPPSPNCPSMVPASLQPQFARPSQPLQHGLLWGQTSLEHQSSTTLPTEQVKCPSNLPKQVVAPLVQSHHARSH
ncbi:uncharacterized protein [Amphiura filiformis]|uniref:uncharacterized protein n=1 Tax=Amphiura filiformis TaxID=82378 RepID=UPI003B21B584